MNLLSFVQNKNNINYSSFNNIYLYLFIFIQFLKKMNRFKKKNNIHIKLSFNKFENLLRNRLIKYENIIKKEKLYNVYNFFYCLDINYDNIMLTLFEKKNLVNHLMFYLFLFLNRYKKKKMERYLKFKLMNRYGNRINFNFYNYNHNFFVKSITPKIKLNMLDLFYNGKSIKRNYWKFYWRNINLKKRIKYHQKDPNLKNKLILLLKKNKIKFIKLNRYIYNINRLCKINYKKFLYGKYKHFYNNFLFKYIKFRFFQLKKSKLKIKQIKIKLSSFKEKLFRKKNNMFQPAFLFLSSNCMLKLIKDNSKAHNGCKLKKPPRK